ncbi:MAG: transporter [Paenibacillaceae bacterium]|nr:transporter [Paenibacillaceae bacterium]
MHMNWKKNIALFLTSQTISLFGSALVQYAIMWYITLETQSGVMMTISIVCGFVPTFLLSPFAGVWADRYNRKRLIILADSVIALSTLIMAVLFLLGYEAMWLLFVISSIRALGSAVHTPTVSAMLPQLVPEDKLTKVNGINGSIQALIMLLAPMASGALLTVAAIEMIFFIDVITAAVAILTLVLFLQVPDHARVAQKQENSYFNDMREGLRYIGKHAFIKQFFIFCAFFFVFAAPAAFLTPLQVARSFGEEVWRLVGIEITFSIGMMLGGLLMASWGGFKNKVHNMALSCLTMGICTVALGLVPVFWIYLGFMSLFGVAMPLFNTPSMVMLQEKVDKDYIGRVFGVFGMISSSMMPLGMLVFGPIADVVAIEWLLLFTGILLCIQSFFLARNRALLEAGKPNPLGSV